MTSYRLLNDGFSSDDELPEDDGSEMPVTDRLPWKVAGPLLVGISLSAWSGIALMFL